MYRMRPQQEEDWLTALCRGSISGWIALHQSLHSWCWLSVWELAATEDRWELVCTRTFCPVWGDNCFYFYCSFLYFVCIYSLYGAHIWRLENNSILPFYHIGPGDQTQVIELGNKWLSPLNHSIAPGPMFLLTKWERLFCLPVVVESS